MKIGITFNGVDNYGNFRSLTRCHPRGHHNWRHSDAEYHHDSSQTHYFTCDDCGRVERDLSDNWKYLLTPARQADYLDNRNRRSGGVRCGARPALEE